MTSLSDVPGIAKQVGSDFSDKNITFMAAGIAYNAFVSLAPLVILMLFLVSLVGGGLEDRLVEVATSSLPGPIAGVISGIASGESAAAGASIVGLVVLLWGTLKIFRGLDTAFSEIYESTEKNGFTDQLKDGTVVFVALVLAIGATVLVTAAFSALSDTIPFVGLLTPLVLIVGLVAAFLPMYKRFPDADLSYRDALPGAIVGAVGWAALQSLFQVYLVFKGGGSSGFFGGVIVVVTWLYFSGLVLLLGAVLNAVLGGHSTGQPGGVGSAIAHRGTETELDDEMDRDELSGYLRDLRERLTGRYEELEPVEDDPELELDTDGETAGGPAGDRPTGARAARADRSEGSPLDDGGSTVLAGEQVPATDQGRGDDVVVREVEGTLRTFRPRDEGGEPVTVRERHRSKDGERVHEVTLVWHEPDAETDGDGDDEDDGGLL